MVGHFPFMQGMPNDNVASFRTYRECTECAFLQANNPSMNDAATHRVCGSYRYFGRRVAIRADPDAFATLHAKYIPGFHPVIVRRLNASQPYMRSAYSHLRIATRSPCDSRSNWHGQMNHHSRKPDRFL